MRVLILTLCLSLQMSVFTCGLDIHVHGLDKDIGHVAEHIHADDQQHSDVSDHACHSHASHTFSASARQHSFHSPLVERTQHFAFAAYPLRNVSYLIEYPPKVFHS